jgi:hypothetical protein
MPLATAKFEMRSDSGEESDTSESSVENDTSEENGATESGSNGLGDSGSLSSVDLGKKLNIDSDKEVDDLLTPPHVPRMVNAIEKNERKTQEEARLARQKKAQEKEADQKILERILEEDARERAHNAHEKETRRVREAFSPCEEVPHPEQPPCPKRLPPPLPPRHEQPPRLEQPPRPEQPPHHERPESSSSRTFKPEVYMSPLRAHKVNRPCRFSDAEQCIGICAHGGRCHNKGTVNRLCPTHIEMQEDAPIKKRRDSLQAKVKAQDSKNRRAVKNNNKMRKLAVDAKDTRALAVEIAETNKEIQREFAEAEQLFMD